MLPGETKSTLAEIDYLLLCHMTLWQNLHPSSWETWQGKKRKWRNGQKTAFTYSLWTLCFLADKRLVYKDYSIKNHLLEEWWKNSFFFFCKVEKNSIRDYKKKWLDEIVKSEEPIINYSLSLSLPVFIWMVASLFIGLVRWLGNKKQQCHLEKRAWKRAIWKKRTIIIIIYGHLCIIFLRRKSRPEKTSKGVA